MGYLYNFWDNLVVVDARADDIDDGDESEQDVTYDYYYCLAIR